jgi:hypothetical protein
MAEVGGRGGMWVGVEGGRGWGLDNIGRDGGEQGRIPLALDLSEVAYSLAQVCFHAWLTAPPQEREDLLGAISAANLYLIESVSSNVH